MLNSNKGQKRISGTASLKMKVKANDIVLEIAPVLIESAATNCGVMGNSSLWVYLMSILKIST